MSKATLYLDEPIHRALRLKAAETNQSMSELVNDALKVSLQEDLEDIKDWRERKDDEPLGYEAFVEMLKQDGTI
jgi:hypothetical protein